MGWMAVGSCSLCAFSSCYSHIGVPVEKLCLFIAGDISLAAGSGAGEMAEILWRRQWRKRIGESVYAFKRNTCGLKPRVARLHRANGAALAAPR